MGRNLGQKLLKVARLYNDAAIGRLQSRGHPLRKSHVPLLPHIDFEHGTRLTELAEAAGITKQSAQRLVDDLVDQGYLAKIDDPEDGRAKRIVYTDLGRRGVIEGLGALDEIATALRGHLGDARLSALDGALEDMLGILEALHLEDTES